MASRRAGTVTQQVDGGPVPDVSGIIPEASYPRAGVQFAARSARIERQHPCYTLTTNIFEFLPRLNWPNLSRPLEPLPLHCAQCLSQEECYEPGPICYLFPDASAGVGPRILIALLIIAITWFFARMAKSLLQRSAKRVPALQGQSAAKPGSECRHAAWYRRQLLNKANVRFPPIADIRGL
jgi:hypothetical protein